MAIGQGNKIIASEINESASTSFSQGTAITAKDIAELYGGTDTIAAGKLILAEHFQNLGLPHSGGLNGEFYTSSKNYKLKEAWEANIIGYTYDDSFNWQLTFPVGGTLKFSNFGKKGSAIDIFMIGGGGAGNKDGISGSGGFYSITRNKILTVNTNYNLVIGAGATTNGASGRETSGFGISVAGGYGGEAHDFKGYYRYATMKAYSGSNLYYYSYNSGTDDQGRLIFSTVDASQGGPQTNVHGGYSAYLKCTNKSGTLKTSSGVSVDGQPLTGIIYHGQYGGYYQSGGISSEESVQISITEVSRPSDEMDKTTGFGGTTYYGGMGSTNSISAGTRYGQGGGSLGTYGNSSTDFGTGKSGLIIIRNHRS